MIKMLFINILNLYILVDGTINAAFLSNKQIKLESKVYTEQLKPNTDTLFKPSIISDKNRFMCTNGNCDMISNFSISETFSFDCHQKLLPIDFVINSIILTGFLDSSPYEVYKTQEQSSSCLKIKRYNYSFHNFRKTKILFFNKDTLLIQVTK